MGEDLKRPQGKKREETSSKETERTFKGPNKIVKYVTRNNGCHLNVGLKYCRDLDARKCYKLYESECFRHKRT